MGRVGEDHALQGREDLRRIRETMLAGGSIPLTNLKQLTESILIKPLEDALHEVLDQGRQQFAEIEKKF